MKLQLVFLICTFAVGALGHAVIQLDADFGVMFHMTTVPGRIEIEVTAKTLGWVGFGFSKTSSLSTSDLVIGGVHDTNETLYHGDYWSTNSNVVPTLDEQQDWGRNDTQCHQNATHTIMYYYRQLDTGDADQDYVIPNGNIYLVWSFGTSDTLDNGYRKEVYSEQINMVALGGHGTGSSAMIQGSVAITLLCVAFFSFF
ncbi:MOXD1 like 2 [Pseudolycoriella hygida]|uniref:MOXD1 like 2 n=1 Tax=Pseudolycoriella hygida TaxID=35572 RepID=A0A9Q0NE30_9DIPT|nr:MOXD1 like 2 [Pseudolycoriella hygida]